jgi:hypothetical protein
MNMASNSTQRHHNTDNGKDVPRKSRIAASRSCRNQVMLANREALAIKPNAVHPNGGLSFARGEAGYSNLTFTSELSGPKRIGGNLDFASGLEFRCVGHVCCLHVESIYPSAWDVKLILKLFYGRRNSETAQSITSSAK